MAIEYLKKATKKPTTGEDQTRDTVSGILRDIEEVGEKKAIEYGNKLDGWYGDIIVSKDAIDAVAALPRLQRQAEEGKRAIATKASL